MEKTNWTDWKQDNTEVLPPRAGYTLSDMPHDVMDVLGITLEQFGTLLVEEVAKDSACKDVCKMVRQGVQVVLGYPFKNFEYSSTLQPVEKVIERLLMKRKNELLTVSDILQDNADHETVKIERKKTVFEEAKESTKRFLLANGGAGLVNSSKASSVPDSAQLTQRWSSRPAAVKKRLGEIKAPVLLEENWAKELHPDDVIQAMILMRENLDVAMTPANGTSVHTPAMGVPVFPSLLVDTSEHETVKITEEERRVATNGSGAAHDLSGFWKWMEEEGADNEDEEAEREETKTSSLFTKEGWQKRNAEAETTDWSEGEAAREIHETETVNIDLSDPDRLEVFTRAELNRERSRREARRLAREADMQVAADKKRRSSLLPEGTRISTESGRISKAVINTAREELESRRKAQGSQKEQVRKQA